MCVCVCGGGDILNILQILLFQPNSKNEGQNYSFFLVSN